MDALGHHIQKCAKGGMLIMRHNRIRDLFHDMFVSAKLQAQMEVPGFYLYEGPDEGDNKRPDHVVYHFEDHARGQEPHILLTDVSGTCPVNPGIVQHCANTAGHAARQVEAGKIRKYPPPDPAYRFQPLVFETFGHWGAHAVQVVKACAVLASQRSISQKDTEAFQRAMWRKLSVAIQKTNWMQYDYAVKQCFNKRGRGRLTLNNFMRELQINE